MRRLGQGLLILLAAPAVAEAGMPAMGPMRTRFAQTLQGVWFFAVRVLLAAGSPSMPVNLRCRWSEPA